MSTWIWALVLIAAVWAAHWGAEHLSDPLKKLRRQWGFSVAAGGSFIGLAAASPEIGIAVTSAVRGVGDISLGASLGSNVLAIPAMVLVAYLATRTKKIEGKDAQEHQRHRQEHLLRVEKGAVRVQALPYLGVLVVFAVLTLPAPWRGLQPLDGWILLGLYVLYLVQALLRGRKEGKDAEWKKQETLLAVGGVAALALGAYFTVRATENIVSALGLSRTVGGLFITAPMAALPEIFATWSVARSGQITSAVTSVIGDHVVTMTLAFFPLALVTLPVEDMQLFGVTLAFVALVGVLYAAFIHWGGGEHGFKRWQSFALVGVYLAYVAVMLLWVLNVFGQGGRKQQNNGSPTSQTTAYRVLTPPSRLLEEKMVSESRNQWLMKAAAKKLEREQ